MAKDEGARGFSVILQELEDGSLHTELSELLQSTCSAIGAHAEAFGKASGGLTITLRLSTERGGPMRVDAELSSKTPKVGRSQTIMWLSKGHNLVPHNPKQTRLPIRDVSAPEGEARDPDGAKAKPVRTL